MVNNAILPFGRRISIGTLLTSELVDIPSYTGREESVVRAIERKMKDFGYDDVMIDGMGNIIGVIGAGEKKIMLKSSNVLKR